MMELAEKLEAKQIIQMAKPRYSTQYVIEILEQYCFDDIRQAGHMHYCNRPGTKEITFRETFGGNHVFYVGNDHYHDVYQAMRMAGAK
ncbi:hypothetical protein [Acetobacterium sp.]|uniref:hypothetical protein n=1 Tax=Acetobacterium sp. TaxID=1872094 RepID=UPI00271ABF34|nr:hypothetical protein [Acetobacterium sp.]MDO9492837.1 hypothetical protein [Acetobacterium sp.]